MSSFDGRWHKSTFSSSSSCVEVRHEPDAIYVRDSKDRGGPVLKFTHREWQAFTQGVRNAQFDVEEPAEH